MKSDSELQKDVNTELSWDPSVSDRNIATKVNNGIVTLAGNVPHFIERTAAENAAQRVSGIKAVVNELEVKIETGFQKSDVDIARDAVESLSWHYQVPEGVKVSVSKGWITLKGKADWDYERSAAINAVSSMLGVVGVSSEIELKSQVQSDDIKTRIEAALKRSAKVESKGITVVVNGSCVTLTGNVHSASEKDDARMAAWAAPGIIFVENNLHVVA